MTWPAVFDGVGALFVGANNDPDVQAARIPGLTWVALKVNGADASPTAEQVHWVGRMRARGLQVGSWVYCFSPPANDAHDNLAAKLYYPTDFVVYDVEQAYKADEGGHREYAAELVAENGRQLVAEHGRLMTSTPAAVTSYGAYKASIDFGAFAQAGWPIFAQAYDSFTAADALTYSHGWNPPGPYELDGVHLLKRSLQLSPGQAVYRPESIDG